MGTRTWSRRGVLTAAGRRRNGLEAINIFGETIPSPVAPAAPVAPVAPVAETPAEGIQKIVNLVKGFDYDRNSPVELGFLLDENGKVVAQVVGMEDRFRVPRDAEGFERVRIITHNHPTSMSFSSADLENMQMYGFEGMEARAPVLPLAERKFLQEMYSVMLAEARKTPLQFSDKGRESFQIVNGAELRQQVESYERSFNDTWLESIKEFADSGTKPWRYILRNEQAIPNPRPTSSDSPNERVGQNFYMERRKTRLTESITGNAMSERKSNMRDIREKVISRMLETPYGRNNPEKARKLANEYFNITISHNIMKATVADGSTYRYGVVFE